MKCPYCNVEMESGFLQSNSGIFWSPRKHQVFITPTHEDEILLANGFLKGSAVSASCCRNCQKIILDYELD
ncbi:hypothetical protein DES36_11567 [Alkalibaculum bacchi]|uniref:DUF6487 domain-containing protein n=1 Tax=Alkalibaculum bacchi TaxID=645887 RepID=A0A366I3Q9_9FIRM|nr:PF20097 family protein [Alkalibaculum bacchi]RBP61068.1 hypothetical protein DES36_11567 [Alkalibaculum bacchi]